MVWFVYTVKQKAMKSIESFPQAVSLQSENPRVNNANGGVVYRQFSPENKHQNFGLVGSPEAVERRLELRETAEDVGDIILGHAVEVRSSIADEIDESESIETSEREKSSSAESAPPDTETDSGNGGERPPEPPEDSPEAPKDPDEEEPEPPGEDPEMGYSDKELLEKAGSLHISSAALDKGRELCYPLELLIRAVESDHGLLYRDLCEQGIPLPESIWTEELPHQETRAERRRADRQAANAGTVYPEHITKSEVHYFLEKAASKPSWLRNSLIRPGSLPVSRELYYNPLARPFLDAVNLLYCPVGKRLLARKLFRNDKENNPGEDYGVAGYGKDRRRDVLDHVSAVDRTVKRSRYLLSWRRRHANRGEARKLARIDLASEIAGVRRDLLAFEDGVLSLTSTPSA